MSTRSSHSQDTSHKGGNHHGRSFSSHSSLDALFGATSHGSLFEGTPDREVDDTLPGKKKGFVDALPPGQELQADRARALNPDTIHSDLDDIVTRGLPPGLELQADRARALNPDAIHSDLDDIVTRGLPPGLELNLDRGKSLPPGWEAKVGPGTIVPDTDDTPATALRLLRSLTRIALRCCPQPILSRTTMTKQTQGGIWLLFSVQRCFSCGDSFLTPRHNLCPTGHVQSTSAKSRPLTDLEPDQGAWPGRKLSNA